MQAMPFKGPKSLASGTGRGRRCNHGFRLIDVSVGKPLANQFEREFAIEWQTVKSSASPEV